MANMSYVRFENTLADLRDCQQHMDEDLSSESEIRARDRLIKVCCDIAQDYGGMEYADDLNDFDEKSWHD